VFIIKRVISYLLGESSHIPLKLLPNFQCSYQIIDWVKGKK
jgi:hypothetical protein